MEFQANKILIFIMYMLHFKNYIKWLYLVFQQSLGKVSKVSWTKCNLLGLVTKKSGGHSRAELEILNHVTSVLLLSQSGFQFFWLALF